jgi:hypothetical protein
MKNNLIWGWIFIGLAILMLACVIYGCFISNWIAVSMCSFALILDICNTIMNFQVYKQRKTEWARFNNTFNTCWPNQDDDHITN